MLPVNQNLLPTVSRLFDNDWTYLFDWSNSPTMGNKTTLPSVNIKETAEAYLIEMAAPGMNKNDFQLELHNNVLHIKAEVKSENELNENEIYSRKEFSYQSFQRSFTLNNQVVNDSKIDATYTDGILHVTLPKKEEAKPKPVRQIRIN